MYNAVFVASRVLSVPPTAGVHLTSQSRTANANYDIVYPHTASSVDISVVQSLRSYLMTIPFVFADSPQCIAGRVLGSGGGVRLFLEESVALACWPIALSMVLPTGRSFNLGLRSEKSSADMSRPDLAVLKIMVDSSNLITRPIAALEFKAPGALAFLANGIPIDDCDDWERVTSQLRKYARTNHFQNVIVMDDRWALHPHVTDAVDPEALVEYIISSITGGAVRFPFPVTARELLLLAVYRGVSSQMPLR